MPNPFYYGGRVNPEQFVGRRAELQRIFAGLEVAHTGQMQSFSVVGPRRIGKSSLLFYLTNKYAGYLAQPANYRFGYVELQDAHCKTLDGLLQTILQTLKVVPLPKALTLAMFQDKILKLKNAGVCPVVCLDEFEDLAHNADEFKHDLYDCWRHLMGENAIAFITASKDSLIDLAKQHDYTSPFFNVFTYLELGEFTNDEALELIDRGVKSDRPFGTGERNQMSTWAGNHPYKLQLAGSLIYEARADGGLINWEELRRKFFVQLEQVKLAASAGRAWKRVGQKSIGTVISATKAAIQESFKAVLNYFFGPK